MSASLSSLDGRRGGHGFSAPPAEKCASMVLEALCRTVETVLHARVAPHELARAAARAGARGPAAAPAAAPPSGASASSSSLPYAARRSMWARKEGAGRRGLPLPCVWSSPELE